MWWRKETSGDKRSKSVAIVRRWALRWSSGKHGGVNRGNVVPFGKHREASGSIQKRCFGSAKVNSGNGVRFRNFDVQNVNNFFYMHNIPF